MAVLFTGKVQGQTAAGAAIATKDVTLDSDGLLRFADANGRPRVVRASGELAALLKEIFSGAGGTTHRHQD